MEKKYNRKQIKVAMDNDYGKQQKMVMENGK